MIFTRSAFEGAPSSHDQRKHNLQHNSECVVADQHEVVGPSVEVFTYHVVWVYSAGALLHFWASLLSFLIAKLLPIRLFA